MAEALERAQDRLTNIRGVEPLLGALRTISLGAWHSALKQKRSALNYAGRLEAMLAVLAAHLPARAGGRAAAAGWPAPANVIALAVGSERGLCGRFNASLAPAVNAYLAQQAAVGARVQLWVLGSRLKRALAGEYIHWAGTLAGGALPSPRLAFRLTGHWLQRYEGGALDRVDVLYNAYVGGGRYTGKRERLLPPRLSAPRPGAWADMWPPPIVETDLLRLYARVVQQWSAVRLHHCLLESASAEHSARAQLMEEATQNAGRLIEELESVTQMARRQAITREIQELAAGAGLSGWS